MNYDNPTTRFAILVAGCLGALYITAKHFDESEWKAITAIAAIIAGDKYNLLHKIVGAMKGSSANSVSESTRTLMPKDNAIDQQQTEGSD